MITLLQKIFVANYKRKLLSVVLSVIIWLLVGQSLISTKTVSNVSVRVINIPDGKTIVDLQSNGILSKKITLNLTGNKNILDELTSSDLEVVIDAQNKQGEWIASVSKRNLSPLNPDIDIKKGITRVIAPNIIIRFTKLVSEKIPIFITQPIGEAPRGYQFLDIWPYQLSLSVTGPEEAVKRLKAKGIRLTFDLSEISKTELDALKARPDASQHDEVSFFVPESWKRVNIPLLSDTPIEINDPRAKDLRIDFVRISLIPINSKLPIALYFPTENLNLYNPKNTSLGSSPLIEKTQGLNLMHQPLYAKGVSQLFVKVVAQMIQLSITVDPTRDGQYLHWSTEFINPRLLEDRFVSLMMSDASETEVRELQPLVREEYLRNRFRSYMNRFQLYLSDDKRLEMNIRLENNKVLIEDGATPLPNTGFLRKE